MTTGGGLKGWTLITGASEGLGREFAALAAAEGRDLILAARQGPRMEELAEGLRARHKIAVEVIACDLSDPAAVEALWRRASARRRIDVLVNNAGLGYNGPFAAEDFTREQASINVNVMALTILTKRAVAHMRAAGGGRILNVASTAAFMPGPNMAVYHAGKAYVLSLSQAVAEELRGTGVTVSVLCPGATATNFQKAARMEDVRLFRMGLVADAAGVAASGWRAMLAGRRVHTPGLFNKASAVGPRLVPGWVSARIAALFLK